MHHLKTAVRGRPGTSRLHPPAGARNRHHMQNDPEPGGLRWHDTPDRQDSLAKGTSTVTGQRLHCPVSIIMARTLVLSRRLARSGEIPAVVLSHLSWHFPWVRAGVPVPDQRWECALNKPAASLSSRCRCRTCAPVMDGSFLAAVVRAGLESSLAGGHDERPRPGVDEHHQVGRFHSRVTWGRACRRRPGAGRHRQ